MPDNAPRPPVASVSASVAVATAAPPVAPASRSEDELDAEVRASLRPEPRSDRYPLTGLKKMLRWLLILPWIGFATYAVYAIGQIAPPVINGQPLGWTTVADDLLLGRLLPVLHGAPLLALVLPLVALAALVLLSRAALRDARHERDFTAGHEKWETEYHRKLGMLRDEDNRLQAEAAHKRAQAAERKAEEAKQDASAAHGRLDDLGGDATPQVPPRELGMLPQLEKPFVGRADDLAWVKRRLLGGGETAITAIDGLGGVGKSTLAEVAASELTSEGHFVGGIAVINCLDRADALGVLRDALARFAARDVKPDATFNDLTTVAFNALHGKDALLIFDNIEPELAIEAVLDPLRAAGATVLLTARHTLPVARDARLELGLLTDAAALDLFAEWYGRPDATALSPAERTAATKVVAALDRHTLAIKLAGAEAAEGASTVAGSDPAAVERYLATFAVEKAAHPLNLTGLGGDVTLALKENLMRSVTHLSDEGARRLFAALAVFPTGEFGSRAVQAIATDTLKLTDPSSAIETLVRRALLDRTIETALPETADRERLRLHPLLRELAASLLDDATRAAASLAIAAFYASYVHESQLPDAARLADADNIAGMLEWAREHAPDDARDGLITRICLGMRNFWRDRSRTSDSLRYLPWAVEAGTRLATSGDRDAQLNRAYLQLSYAEVLITSGRLPEAEDHINQSLAICRAVGDTRGEGVALSKLGDFLRQRGDLAGAQANYERARAIMAAVDDTREEGVAHIKIAQVAELAGDLDHAESFFRAGIQALTQLGLPNDSAASQRELGRFLIQHRRGKPDEGCAMLRQAIALYHQMGVPDEQEARALAASLGCDVE
ncbi:MAG: tetratricopeptide repeat protein [Ktedonobacterales bacterium]